MRKGLTRRLGAILGGLYLLLPSFAMAQDWTPGSATRLVGEDRTVTVYNGQSLYDVARAHGYAMEHLARANKLPISLEALYRTSLTLPQRRILPPEPPTNGIVVNLPERGFYLFRQGRTPEFFPVAIGEPGRFQTPTGNFDIRERVKDPEWIAPEWAGLGEENVVAAGPDNPLGDRWIGLSSSGLGMHSTNMPSSIGSASSHGCMRMYPEIARNVFDKVEVSWPVRIEYQTNRVTLENDGIYAVSFDSPYPGNRSNSLQENFQALDLLGFFKLLDLDSWQKEANGVCAKVVDFEPKVKLSDGRMFPAARIGQGVYLESSTIAALGLHQEIRLSDSSVILSRGSQKATFQLASDKTASPTFLSRGTTWYSAKAVLSSLGLGFQWSGPDKRLLIHDQLWNSQKAVPTPSVAPLPSVAPSKWDIQ